jgi:ribonuclease P protein subunit POP4
MNITPQNFLRHELVGLTTHIVESRDPHLLCKRGIILSESKEMIQLDTEGGPINAPKGVCVFDITLPSRSVVRVEGKMLIGRPEDRVKKHLNRSW